MLDLTTSSLPKRILVLGLGNILLTDEGVGIHAITHLRRFFDFSSHITLIDGGTSATDLIDTIADHDALLVLDAIQTGEPPATLVTVQGEAIAAFFRQKLSPHQMGLGDLLALLALENKAPQLFVLLGITPCSMATGIGLSEEVATQLPQLIDQTIAQLKQWGQNLLPREHPKGLETIPLADQVVLL